MGEKKHRKAAIFKTKRGAAGVYQDSKAAVQAVTAMDENASAESMVAVLDGAYAGARIYADWQKLKLKAAVKPGVKIGKGYYKAIKRIRTAKKSIDLMNAASSAEVVCPHVAVRGPSAQLSEKTKQELCEKRQAKADNAKVAALPGTAGTNVQAELVRLPEPVIKNAREYDISGIEKRNGISSGKRLYVSAKTSTENLEQKNKVRSREEERAGKNAPKERTKLQGEEKAEHVADKNKVHSKKQKDNLRKKKDKPKRKPESQGNGKAALKREMKYFIVKQILAEGEDSGAGELVINVGSAVLSDRLKSLGRISLKLANVSGKLALKLIWKLLAGLLVLLLHILGGLLVMLLPVLLIGILVLAVPVIIVVIAAMIVGLFVSPVDTTRDDFAVTVINEYQDEVYEEALDYVGKLHDWKRVDEVKVTYKGISNLDSNSDDILLVYFAKATDEGKFDEDTSQAPLLNVNTITEKWVMNDVLDDMLYIDSVTYAAETRKVIVWVTPTATPTPEPTIVIVPTPTASPVPTVTELPVPTVTPTPIPTITPMPTVTPAPTPIPTLSLSDMVAALQKTPTEEVEQETNAEELVLMWVAEPMTADEGNMGQLATSEQKLSPMLTATPSAAPVQELVAMEVEKEFYVANVVIAGKSAEAWAADNLSSKEKSVYEFLKEMFVSFGYQEMGGDTVCQKYSESTLE